MLATADDFGKVKIFRYPVPENGYENVEGRGHSSHVTNVKFSPTSDRVFTTGGND